MLGQRRFDGRQEFGASTGLATIWAFLPWVSAGFLPAQSGQEAWEEPKGEGAAQVVAKPVDVPQLLTAIETSLAQPLVLVVDDDADFCENLWQILCKRGFRLALRTAPTRPTGN